MEKKEIQRDMVFNYSYQPLNNDSYQTNGYPPQKLDKPLRFDQEKLKKVASGKEKRSSAFRT